MKFIMFYCCFLLFSSNCRYASSSIVEEQGIIVINTDDCFNDRKNEKEIVLKKLSIVKIGTEYILQNLEENQRYNACNLPELCKKEGLLMECTFILKEIFPYERRMATPVLLMKVKLL